MKKSQIAKRLAKRSGISSAEAADQFASRAVAECAQRIELAAANRNFIKAAQDLATLRREIQALSALV